MQRRQNGMTLIGMILTLMLIGFFALIVLKLTPVYIDYFSVKKAASTAAKASTDPAAIRAAFDRAALIDKITVIKGRDLQISGGGAGTVVSFEYDETVHLFGNISLLIEFEGKSGATERGI